MVKLELVDRTIRQCFRIADQIADSADPDQAATLESA